MFKTVYLLCHADCHGLCFKYIQVRLELSNFKALVWILSEVQILECRTATSSCIRALCINNHWILSSEKWQVNGRAGLKRRLHIHH